MFGKRIFCCYVLTIVFEENNYVKSQGNTQPRITKYKDGWEFLCGFDTTVEVNNNAGNVA